VILITHDLTVVSGLADRVLVMYAGHKIEEATAADLFRAPLHPYTRGLLNAVPKPGMSRETARLTAIGGQVPALRGVPDACVFADRCRYVIDDCRAGQPPLREVDPGHSAACLRAADVADLEDQ
jgi:oligopeptide/dipeptide ABC transporter ATP-binding protein